MMQERASSELVGSVSLFKTDWEARSSEIGSTAYARIGAAWVTRARPSAGDRDRFVILTTAAVLVPLPGSGGGGIGQGWSLTPIPHRCHAAPRSSLR